MDINYPALIDEVDVGDVLLVDNGLMRFEVEELLIDRLRYGVVIPGSMGSRRHINIPGKKINLPAMTEKDVADAKVGIEAGVDFFALSFVREASDVVELKQFLNDHSSQAKVVSKIEDEIGIASLNEIIEVSDALMVAGETLASKCLTRNYRSSRCRRWMPRWLPVYRSLWRRICWSR